MKKTFLILFCMLAMATPTIYAQFGFISYSTTNIGDDIQAVAAKRFLPQNAIPIDRDFISEFKHSQKIDTIVNGFYMHTQRLWWCHKNPAPACSWPPSNAINPLFISFHLSRQFMPLAFTEEGLKFFKAHQPIGTRDYDTLVELKDRGIKAYFSGCITLTLENPYKKRDNIVYIVDLPQQYVDYLRKKIKGSLVEVLSHSVPSEIQYNVEARLRHAEGLLEKYRKAKCVITSKLHVSMPCLALETPVLLVGKLNERFYGLRELVRNCTEDELLRGEYNFDFNNPTPNTKAYLPLRENIIKKVTHWVNEKKRK